MILFPLSAQSGVAWQRAVSRNGGVCVERVLIRGDLMEKNGKGEQKCSETWGTASESFLGVSEDFGRADVSSILCWALVDTRGRSGLSPWGPFALVIPVFD